MAIKLPLLRAGDGIVGIKEAVHGRNVDSAVSIDGRILQACGSCRCPFQLQVRYIAGVHAVFIEVLAMMRIVEAKITPASIDVDLSAERKSAGLPDAEQALRAWY